jgi:hypothetical protein
VSDGRALHRLLSRQLRELLCDQVMILSELLQQMGVRRLLKGVLLQHRIDLLQSRVRLRPCAGGLSLGDSLGPVDGCVYDSMVPVPLGPGRVQTV